MTRPWRSSVEEAVGSHGGVPQWLPGCAWKGVPRMRIRDLFAQDTLLVEQVSAILVRAFAEHWPDGWPDLEAARNTVRASVINADVD